ncbi:MAG: TetR/AcrR family transcriptional regulator [Eubacteriales bacterium]|nr:TetR/AcrR family transcriptional regulator [Eubacteriales bacterium]
MKEKKTDRRTLYTRHVICEAFLKRKASKDYNDITVAELCREAEISRGTFYLHYKNTGEVLDEVLDRILSESSSLSDQLCPDLCAPGDKCRHPLCRYIRSHREYHCLFFDDALSSYILSKIYISHKEDIINVWAEKTGLPREQLEMIAYFQLSGCFAAVRKSAGMDDGQWENTKAVIDRFIQGGLLALESPQKPSKASFPQK